MLKEAAMYRRRADVAYRWGLLLMFVALMLLFRGAAFAQEPGPGPTAADGSVGSKVLNVFLQYALPPIVTALAAIIVWALKKLGDYLHAKADGSKVGQALVVGTDFIGAAVSHVVAGLAPDVRAALADDGVISEAERNALKSKAIALIKAELPDGIKAVLGGVMQGGLDTWLSGTAEKAIALATGSVPTAAAGPAPTVVP
jgi:hypothetical protein